MAIKKITAVTPEAPSAESALYDVTLQKTNDDGVVQETHQTMTEAEIIAEADAEQAQETVQEPPQASVVDNIQEAAHNEPEAVVEANNMAVEETASEELVAVAEKASPHQEGYACYFLGGDLGQNPYMDITEEYFAWNAGWAKGFDEANKVKE